MSGSRTRSECSSTLIPLAVIAKQADIRSSRLTQESPTISVPFHVVPMIREPDMSAMYLCSVYNVRRPLTDLSSDEFVLGVKSYKVISMTG